jgi:hypothetical protein
MVGWMTGAGKREAAGARGDDTLAATCMPAIWRRDWGRPWATVAPPPRRLDRSKRGSPGRGGLWDGKAGELPHLPTLVYHPWHTEPRRSALSSQGHL